MTDISFPRGDQKLFNEWLVIQYFKFGSVDEVLRNYDYQIPISYASYQRILDSWGIVKNAGPNNKLSEVIEFFSNFALNNESVKEYYSKMPPSFQTSMVTLHRVLSYIKEGITRRVGTALIITPYNDKNKILMGSDISTPRIEVGKPFASMSLPMGFSRKRDLRTTKILRVLQNEVFTEATIKKQFPNEILNNAREPFMYVDIADVRVAVYHIQLPRELSAIDSFSSYKLKDYLFYDIKKKDMETKYIFRAGVKEIITGYEKYLKVLARNLKFNPLQYRSSVNEILATVEIDI